MVQEIGHLIDPIATAARGEAAQLGHKVMNHPPQVVALESLYVYMRQRCLLVLLLILLEACRARISFDFTCRRQHSALSGLYFEDDHFLFSVPLG